MTLATQPRTPDSAILARLSERPVALSSPGWSARRVEGQAGGWG